MAVRVIEGVDEIFQRFLNGEFALHVGNQLSKFFDIADEYALKWNTGEVGSDLNLVGSAELCIDHGVHNNGREGWMYHDPISYYRNNSYKVVEFSDFLKEFSLETYVQVNNDDLMALICDT